MAIVGRKFTAPGKKSRPPQRNRLFLYLIEGVCGEIINSNHILPIGGVELL